LTLDEFLRLRVRLMVTEEVERSREDALALIREETPR
jgi:hypothetical protein